ncbi:GntR family transcriptional regulator [Cellulomonas sp. HZM]|uniref:GntR family transcriptional regulator n=1 Tax=Cellulomonas sp. HZM TaxID=1454010 RepID=UPI0004939C4D|nr:GntR family transcriptional regulator [Cellulomonas sp. HZM]
MLLRIDTSSPEPLFEQIGSQVRSLVARGDLAAGTRLPAARDLATSLDVNLHTVLRAYQDLRDDGVIELRRGRGAVVADVPDHARLHAAIDQVVAAARDLDVPPATTMALLKEALR